MSDNNISKIKNDDDPDRCQAVVATGQCRHVKAPGSTNCIMHGGNKAGQAAQKNSVNQYRIAKYNSRINELTGDPENLKSLRAEISLLRILIEEQFESIGDDKNQLLLRTPLIADLITKVEKIVSSCQRLETQLGGMLDKAQAIQLAQEIVSLIDSLISDKEIVNRIAEGILIIITRISQKSLEPK